MTDTKYHVGSDGSAKYCHASTQACPLGGNEDGSHGFFSDSKEAQAWAEKRLKEEYGGFFGKQALKKGNDAAKADLNVVHAKAHESSAQQEKMERALPKALRSANRWRKAHEVMKSLRGNSLNGAFARNKRNGKPATLSSNVKSKDERSSSGLDHHAYINPNGVRHRMGPSAASRMKDYEANAAALKTLRDEVYSDQGVPDDEKEDFYEARKEEIEEEMKETADELQRFSKIDAKVALDTEKVSYTNAAGRKQKIDPNAMKLVQDYEASGKALTHLKTDAAKLTDLSAREKRDWMDEQRVYHTRNIRRVTLAANASYNLDLEDVCDRA